MIKNKVIAVVIIGIKRNGNFDTSDVMASDVLFLGGYRLVESVSDVKVAIKNEKRSQERR